MFRIKRISCWWLMLAVLCLPRLSAAAEFSALMLVKDAGKVVTGKIYVRGGLMRQEFNDEEGQTITIVRPDKKVVWVIIPRDRAYMELPLKPKLPGQFLQMPPDALHKLQVGKDRLQGYDTDKFEVSVQGGSGLEQQTIWLAPKLGLPIKLECRARKFCLEYNAIKEAKVADRLFELPPGYQKLGSSRGFADKIED
jgi:hypothetical protein